MSLWWDAKAKRYRIRIRRRGQEVRELLPAGITREQADQRHAKLMRDLYDHAALGKRPSYSIADAINRYVEEYAPRLKNPENVRSNVRALLPFVRGKDLDALEDVARMVSKHRGHSAATRNRRLALLRRVGGLARKWGWINREPHIELLPGERSRNRYLSRGEIEILAWFAEQWHPLAGDYILIAAYTGMRQGEVLALTKTNIRDNAIWLYQTKTDAPRAVPIVPRIASRVRRWVRVAKPHKRTLYGAFEQARDALLLGDLRYHDLRHSAASLLINAGVDLYTVGTILGHSDPRTTQRYAHLAVDKLRGAMERIAPDHKRKAA